MLPIKAQLVCYITLVLVCSSVLVIGKVFKKYSLETDAQNAFEHGVRVREQGACKEAKPQIIYVNSTDPSKVFLPRATILHRCSDSTGCCAHASQTCQPIQTQNVHLFFFTFTLHLNKKHPIRNNHKIRHHQRIEKFTFNNHTHCGCKLRNSNLENEIDSVDLIK